MASLVRLVDGQLFGRRDLKRISQSIDRHFIPYPRLCSIM